MFFRQLYFVAVALVCLAFLRGIIFTSFILRYGECGSFKTLKTVCFNLQLPLKTKILETAFSVLEKLEIKYLDNLLLGKN